MTAPASLRLWPGVLLVVVQWLLWLVAPSISRDLAVVGLLGGVLCGVLVFLWWLFLSRAPWLERLAVLAFMPVALVATRSFVDQSISNGLMGRMLYLFSIPALSLALVTALVITRQRSIGIRRATIAIAILIACASFALIRTGGITGDAVTDLHWRWTPTPEQRLLAKESTSIPSPAPPPAIAAPAAVAPAETRPTPSSDAPSVAAVPTKPEAHAKAAPSEPASTSTAPTVDPVTTAARAEWPGFRGPNRDDVVTGVRLETDWSKTPPVQMWKRPIGPGWSSFAVQGELLYTQEQRGEDELVSCYRVSTGEPVWRHRDPVRFYESNAGAGPRATPAISAGRVYALGATGILNALDARTGAVIWSRNAATDTGAKLPGWGFAGSPLVLDDLVIVATSGRLAAFDAATGKVRWRAPAHLGGYSSPQLMTIGGVPQILLLNGDGIASVTPANGTPLWEHAWSGVPMLQPARTPDGDVLITSGDAMGGMGTRRIALMQNAGAWTATERWASRGLKPYFNDFVVHKGYAFGFDGNILASIDLTDGSRKWKGGRYGNGQLLLLAEQDLLLVVSEEGELALVKATPDQFTELARFPAIEGKTWNHPVLVHDILLVRNGEEMAAFRLPVQHR
jgi:outer membrane protein assembly factor BamB